MNKLKGLEPQRVFEFFEEISGIPRGSGNMKKIADYCVSFAEKRGLKYLRDEADNVVIFKDATKGYENADAVILQGHLDMVCQKTEESEIDFLSDGLDLFVDGDFIKANGTTLGADNGIAVAMGSYGACIFQNRNIGKITRLLKQYKLPVKPSSWGITEEIFVAAWQQASASRPDRYNILNETDLSYERLAGLYKEMEEVFA